MWISYCELSKIALRFIITRDVCAVQNIKAFFLFLFHLCRIIQHLLPTGHHLACAGAGQELASRFPPCIILAYLVIEGNMLPQKRSNTFLVPFMISQRTVLSLMQYGIFNRQFACVKPPQCVNPDNMLLWCWIRLLFLPGPRKVRRLFADIVRGLKA